MRALRQVGRWPEASEVRPWLLRIATNYCLNELRSRRVRGYEPPQLAMRLTSNLEDRLMARSEVAQLLQRLPKRARDVARLTYVEGLRQQEVAEALGVSRRTVVNYLTHVRSCWSGAAGTASLANAEHGRSSFELGQPASTSASAARAHGPRARQPATISRAALASTCESRSVLALEPTV
jgi:DNA-binding CsgD family transcriptional regulator